MKKLSTSVSPFLMMILPVVLFIGLSLTMKSSYSPQEEFSSISAPSKTTIIMKVGEQSLVRFLLRK
ncbi:MAG: hypothetical protein ABIP95_03840 [Pelobium sp.]